jgi:hypothetical protein
MFDTMSQTISWVEGEVVEIPLLMSGRLADALEEEARHQGLTVGELLRRLVREFLRYRLRAARDEGRAVCRGL